MALGDIFELAVRQTLWGIAVVNVWHFRDETGAGDAQMLADDFRASLFVNTWRSRAYSSLQFGNISTRQIYPYVLNAGVAAMGFDGILTGNAFAPVVAAVVTWTTGVRGKRYRGRTYFAGLSGNMAQGAWDATMMGNLTSLASQMLSDYGEGGVRSTYRLGVWSRRNGVIDDTTTSAAGFTPVVGAVARSYVCSMGTRRAGHGI
jgi:hypothetical protein